MKKKELKKQLRKANTKIEILNDTIHYDKITIKSSRDSMNDSAAALDRAINAWEVEKEKVRGLEGKLTMTMKKLLTLIDALKKEGMTPQWHLKNHNSEGKTIDEIIAESLNHENK